MKIGRLLLLLALIITGIILFVNKCTNKSDVASNGQNGPQPLMVNGYIVRTQDIDEMIYASGTLLAQEEVEIRNEIAGKISAILFKEGSKINKGELLVTMYDDDLQAQLKKLKVQKELAETTKERQKDLLLINGISQQDYELSLNQLNIILADIELIQAQISKTKITAPFNGVIGLKSVSAGANIPANTKIATMQEIDPIKLEFAIPEKYRPMITEQTEVNFTTESTEGIFTGKIYAFEPKIDLATRTLLVRALCSNSKFDLYPGAFANIEIPLKQVNHAILIPTQSLVPELKGQKVFVVRNDKAEKISVLTGMRNDSSIQITSGLREGDTVLTTGIMQVRPGMSLQVNVKSYSNN